jgi:hypothetical protein
MFELRRAITESTVVIRLDGLPHGTYTLTVTYRGVNGTNSPTITIQ